MTQYGSKASESVRPTDIRIPVDGMTCAACALRIERKLGKLDGVATAGVNYAAEEAVVTVGVGKIRTF